MGRQGCLDFRQFDPVAANFDLPVFPAQEAQQVFPEPTAQIAGAKPALSVRVRHEALGRQMGSVEIPASNSGAADIYLTRDAHWHRPSGAVQYPDFGSIDRLADGRRKHLGPASRGHDVLASRHAALRRTVGVDNAHVAMARDGVEAAQHAGVHHLAAQNEQADPRGRTGCRPVIHQHGEQAGSGVAQVQLVRVNEGRQPCRVGSGLLGREIDLVAVQQGGENLLHRGVEGVGGDARNPQPKLGPEQGEQRVGHMLGEINHRAVLDYNPLRLARTAAGEDDVRRLSGANFHRRSAPRQVVESRAVVPALPAILQLPAAAADDEVIAVGRRIEPRRFDCRKLEIERLVLFGRPILKEGAGNEQVLKELEPGLIALPGMVARERRKVGAVAVHLLQIPDAAQVKGAIRLQQLHGLRENIPQIAEAGEVFDQAVQNDEVERSRREQTDIMGRQLPSRHLIEAVAAGVAFHALDVAAGDVASHVACGQGCPWGSSAPFWVRS